EQKRRLRERLERPDKYWKFNPADIDERAYWPAYQEAYQAMLDRTHTGHAPWYVIPADRKWYARLAVTELLIDALSTFQLDWPPAQFDVAEQLRRLDRA
ncbi:polyphosphate kinase 2 family protein, partial [Nocardia nova]|nr:polyphosphate kinase 2 family protein [Nocardia nova]